MIRYACVICWMPRGKQNPSIKAKQEAPLIQIENWYLPLVKCIEIIGEAAIRISNESREVLPQIPWANIIGMRNRLIYAYFDINLDILWKTVIEDLPSLIFELERIVES